MAYSFPPYLLYTKSKVKFILTGFSSASNLRVPLSGGNSVVADREGRSSHSVLFAAPLSHQSRFVSGQLGAIVEEPSRPDFKVGHRESLQRLRERNASPTVTVEFWTMVRTMGFRFE